MHLVTVPQIGSGRRNDPLRPAFGDLTPLLNTRPHGWGQAASERARRVRVWLNAEPEELARVVRAPGVVLEREANAATMREARRLVRALRTEKAPRIGARWNMRDEFVDLYGGSAPVQRPARDLRAEAFDLAQRMAALIVLGAPLHVLMRLFASAPLDVRAVLTVVSSDSFTHAGANNLNGLDMINTYGGAANFWEVLTGSGTVDASVCVLNNFGAKTVAIDTDMSTVAICRTTINGTANQDNPSALARVADASNFYYARSSNPTQLFKQVSASDTQLGSNGSDPSTNDVGCDCSGTSISLLVNGSVDIGPITDSAFASGVLGIGSMGGYANLTKFVGEYDSGGGGATVRGLVGRGLNIGLINGGLAR